MNTSELMSDYQHVLISKSELADKLNSTPYTVVAVLREAGTEGILLPFSRDRWMHKYSVAELPENLVDLIAEHRRAARVTRTPSEWRELQKKCTTPEARAKATATRAKNRALKNTLLTAMSNKKVLRAMAKALDV